MKYFDIFCASLTIIALWLIPKNYKWWLLYCLCCLMFLYVRYSAGQVGSIFLELCAFSIGLNNYLKLKKDSR